VLIKPKRDVDPDDLLTPEESSLIAKARREMREGKYVTLARLEHDLAHQRSQRRRKGDKKNGTCHPFSKVWSNSQEGRFLPRPKVWSNSQEGRYEVL
jgi:hypothetical protein